MKRVATNIVSGAVLCIGMLTAASTSASAYEFRDLGTVILTGHWRCPPMTLEADGRILDINSNVALFSALGTTFGGDGRQTFGLPDLRNAVPQASTRQGMRYCVISSMVDESAEAESDGDGAGGDQPNRRRDHRGEAPGGGDEIIAPNNGTSPSQDGRIDRQDSDRENEVVPARRGHPREDDAEEGK